MVLSYGNSFDMQTVLNVNRKSESKFEFSVNNNKSKSFLCSTTIITLLTKHLNSARSFNLKENQLHVLLDSGSGESFVNKRWILYGKQTKKVKPTTWVTGIGTMQIKWNVNLKFK